MADWLRSVDDVLAAASAALGVRLSAPDDLGGSERSAVWRCRMPGDGTVVVKTYPDSAAGREGFAAEAAGLALTGDAGAGPRLLAAIQRDRLIVMTDLGSGPSLADLLLGGPADAAQAALLSWARACGDLAVAMAGRETELAALLTAHRFEPETVPARHWLERRIGEIPRLLADLSLPSPAGLAADLAEVTSILEPWQYPVFSPGDICPDNNLLIAGRGAVRRLRERRIPLGVPGRGLPADAVQHLLVRIPAARRPAAVGRGCLPRSCQPDTSRSGQR